MTIEEAEKLINLAKRGQFALQWVKEMRELQAGKAGERDYNIFHLGVAYGSGTGIGAAASGYTRQIREEIENTMLHRIETLATADVEAAKPILEAMK
jgi:hypothetical protein